MKRIIKKMRGKVGESIGETLVALLISSLALLMLAGAISASTRVITASKAAMQAYYEENNKIATLATTDALSIKLTASGLSETQLQTAANLLTVKGEANQANSYSNEKSGAVAVIGYSLNATPSGGGGL